MRFNVGTLLIVTTFFAGLVASTKYGTDAVGVYIVMVCFSMVTFAVILSAIKADNADDERARLERNGD